MPSIVSTKCKLFSIRITLQWTQDSLYADDSLAQSGSQRAAMIKFCMYVLYIFTNLLKVNNYYDLNFCWAQRVKPELNPFCALSYFTLNQHSEKYQPYLQYVGKAAWQNKTSQEHVTGDTSKCHPFVHEVRATIDWFSLFFLFLKALSTEMSQYWLAEWEVLGLTA